MSARGSVRPGSRTSSPANVTLFQADCEKNGPTSAAANDERERQPAEFLGDPKRRRVRGAAEA